MWFGEDATLRRLPDPLREKSSRPLMLAADELDLQLKTSWTKVENYIINQGFLNEIGGYLYFHKMVNKGGKMRVPENSRKVFEAVGGK